MIVSQLLVGDPPASYEVDVIKRGQKFPSFQESNSIQDDQEVAGLVAIAEGAHLYFWPAMDKKPSCLVVDFENKDILVTQNGVNAKIYEWVPCVELGVERWVLEAIEVNIVI